MNSPHKGPITRKMFPFDDVVMTWVALADSLKTHGILDCITQRHHVHVCRLIKWPVTGSICFCSLLKINDESVLRTVFVFETIFTKEIYRSKRKISISRIMHCLLPMHDPHKVGGMATTLLENVFHTSYLLVRKGIPIHTRDHWWASLMFLMFLLCPNKTFGNGWLF